MTMKTEHKYAQVLRWIADGEDVQWKNKKGDWEYQDPAITLHEAGTMAYSTKRYRIAPKRIQKDDEATLVSYFEEMCKELKEWPEGMKKFVRPVVNGYNSIFFIEITKEQWESERKNATK